MTGCSVCHDTGLIAVQDADGKVVEEICPWCKEVHEQPTAGKVTADRATKAWRSYKGLINELDELSVMTKWSVPEIRKNAHWIQEKVTLVMVRLAVLKSIMQGKEESDD